MPHVNTSVADLDWKHRLQPPVPMQQAAAAKGLKFGFAWSSAKAAANAKLHEVFLRESSGGVAAPENEALLANLQATQGVFTFTAADSYLSTIQAAGMTPVQWGHLVWHYNQPSWLTAITDPTLLRAAMETHIAAVVGHYAPLGVSHWNVVNEVINDVDGLTGGYRNSFWYQVLGSDYIAWAFAKARATDPNATLILNQNRMDTSGSAGRDAVLALLTSLIGAGVPVDGLGVQLHLWDGSVCSGQTMADFLNTVAALKPGFKIYVTELDVYDKDYTLPARYASCAQMVTDMLGPICAQVSALQHVVCWSVSDQTSFMNNDAFSARADGYKIAGANPFDRSGRSNPMAKAITDCFALRP